MNPCEITVHTQGKKKKENVKLENVPQDSTEFKRSLNILAFILPYNTLK